MAEKEIILQSDDGQVDELVLTTHEETSCSSLEDCVRMLFPQEGESAPRLRFKGFEGAWEKKLLSDCLEISDEKNIDNAFGVEDVLSVSDDYGVVNQIEHLGRSYAGKSVSGYKILRPGQIVYTKSPLRAKPYGIVKMNRGKAGIVSVLYAVYNTKEGVAPEYIHYYFDPAWRLNAYMRPLVNKGAKNTMNISDETALTGYIMIPKDIDEQRKIASFLQRLDEQVTVYQKQFDELKQLKLACLETMFPQQNECAPTLRFNGFNDDWVVTKLSEISKKVTKKNTDLAVRTTLTNSAEFGIINQLDFFDHDIANGDNIRGYYVVENDDFVYNPRISTSAPVGPINRNQLGYSGVMSPLYYVFKVEGIDKDYLSCFFKTNRWHKFMFDNGNTGARFDRLSISDEVFGQMPIRHPKDSSEQKLIAEFFNQLDSKISAQHEQLERLKEMKQSCLGLLFADNQSITPPLRFKGFNGEWIMIRFSDIATIRRGLTYSPENIRDRGVRVLRSSNIDEDAFTISDSDVFVDSRCVNIPLANNGDILVTAANGSPRLVGKHCLVESDDEKMVPGGFMYLVSSDEAEFLNACMGASWYKKFLVTGVSGGNGAIGNLSKDELEKCEFYIPKEKEERNRIASFFTNLDKQITLQSQQVEKLMQLKKACLNQFIA